MLVFFRMVSSRIIQFSGDESKYIDEEQLKRTVKLSPLSHSATGYEDVFRALEQVGVQPEDIKGLYKVSVTDLSYLLYLSNDTIQRQLRALKIIGTGKCQFSVVAMNEQTVRCKIHWLPLYYSDRLLKAIFCDYGEVLEIQMCKSSYAHVCAYNGQREVLLRTDEFHKQQIPHLVKLASGHSILITLQGRPPLCLKCGELGHTRKDCPSNKKDYSGAARSGSSSANTGTVSAPAGAHVSSAVPGPAVPPPGADSAPAPAPEGSPAGAGEAPSPQDLGPGGSDGSGDTPGTQEPMEANDQLKRKNDGDDDDDFLTPNRTAKQRPGPYPNPPLHLPLSQGYKALLGDLTPPTPTPK